MGRYFYSEPSSSGEQTLDDAITNFELTLSTTLNDIRSKGPGARVAPDVAAAIVTHLATRTEHVRSTLAELVEGLFDRMRKLFAEPESVAAMIGLDGDVPTERFREFVGATLGDSPELAALGVPARLLERMGFALLRENWSDFAGQAGDLVAAIVEAALTRSDELARGSHNEALERIGTVGGNKATLRSFEWTVAPATGAILPDCVVVALGEDGTANTHLFLGGEKLAAVALAVSPD